MWETYKATKIELVVLKSFVHVNRIMIKNLGYFFIDK